jgi:3-deoxy-D-manno-octulosonic-acid transferase
VTRAVYTAALSALLAGYAPLALYRRLTRGVPVNLAARLGGLAPVPARPPRGWVHAVSVGETLAAEPLIRALRRTWADLPLVVTTVTETGARVARDRLRGVAEHRFFPFDIPWCVGRALDVIEPAFLVCMETELWPNTLRAMGTRGAPVVIANGRISDRSLGRYAAVRPLLRPVLHDVRVFAMQSEEDARRIVRLGAPAGRVFVTGNLKHEAGAGDPGAAPSWRARLGLGPDRPVWVAGSTHAGEEDAVLRAHRAARARWPDLALVLAPRHPERAGEVLRLVGRHGLDAVRRTQCPEAGQASGGGAPAVIVLDTVGELAALYALADVAFVGGSLVPVGGHNPLEPARMGKPVLLGPHTDNFRDAAGLLLDAGAARRVADGAALAAELVGLLADPPARAALGEAARDAAGSRGGAVTATLDLIRAFVLDGDGRVRPARGIA